MLLFLVLAWFDLEVPGLHYDEALEGGLPAAQLLNQGRVAALDNVALHLGGRSLPLMVQKHIGAAQVYAALPFVVAGGPTAASLRAMTVLVGLVTIAAVHLFVAQVYGRFAAFWASMWLAAFTSFVFWSRQGVFVTSLAPCFAMLALAGGARWWRTGGGLVLALAGLCAGLAIYSKLNALWLLNGVIGWGLVSLGYAALRRRARGAATHDPVSRGAGQVMPPLGWRELMLFAGGVAAGLAPLVLYNLLSGWATLRTVRGSATETYLGQNNTEVLRNLVVRLAQAADVVRSGDHLWYLGGTFRNDVALGSVLIALVILVLASVRGGWRTALLVPFLALAVIAQSCFTISALWPTHFAVATPLPAMIFGIAVARLYTSMSGRRQGARLGRTLIVLSAVAVVASQAATSWRYRNAVTASGGLSFHSASIYDLSRFLDGRAEHAVALDWGLATPVEYLSGGKRDVEELYQYQPGAPGLAEALRPRFDTRGDDLYITHATNAEAFPQREAFLGIVAESGHWAERVETFMGRSGNAEIEVWRVRRP